MSTAALGDPTAHPPAEPVDLVPDPGSGRATLLCIVVSAWVIVPHTLQSVTAPKFRTAVGADGPGYSPLASASLTALGLVLLGLSALLIVESLRRNPQARVGRLLLLLAPWVFLEIHDWTLGVPIRLGSLTYPLLVTALWTLRPGRAQLRVIGHSTVVIAVLSCALGVLRPSQAILRSAAGDLITEDKNLLPGGILVGIFTSGNTLGQVMVVGLPAVAMIRSPRVRAFGLVVCVVALVWSSSRSSLLTLGLVLALTLLLLAISARYRPPLVRVLLVLLWGLVVVLPLVTSDPLAFTNRGYIWGVSLQAWRARPVVGWGDRFYTDISRTSENLGGTVYHGHNQLVHLLVTGGVVLVVLAGVLIATTVGVVARRSATDSVFGFAFLASLAGGCVLEVSLAFLDNTFLFGLVVVPLAVLLFGAPLPPRPVRASQAPPVRRPVLTADRVLGG